MTTPTMFSGHHVVVTGTGCGIGTTIAAQLATQGATLMLIDHDVNVLQATAKTLSDGACVQVVTCDVVDEVSVATAFEFARTGLGPISILVSNTGQAESVPFAKTTLNQWQRMLSVNLTGTFLYTQATSADVQALGRGRIVNIVSTAGQRGYAYVSAYVAAKHGVIGLTCSLALELAARGITVSAVCPGYTGTDIMCESIDRIVARTGRSVEEALAELMRGNPQGRLITPDEVANAVVRLCSDGASSITGQAISVSSGEVV